MKEDGTMGDLATEIRTSSHGWCNHAECLGDPLVRRQPCPCPIASPTRTLTLTLTLGLRLGRALSQILGLLLPGLAGGPQAYCACCCGALRCKLWCGGCRTSHARPRPTRSLLSSRAKAWIRTRA